MNEEKRMAGDYEIIYALRIGDREIVVGENRAKPEHETYMCAFCLQNDFFDRYEDVRCSDDYPEIIGIFGQRVATQAEHTRAALVTPKFMGITNAPLSAADCTPISSEDNLNQKVVVIRPDVLRREYRRATEQVALCTGGFGASPNSRGSACFCVNLFTGEKARVERHQIMGVLKEEQRPKWVKHYLQAYQQEQQRKKQVQVNER